MAIFQGKATTAEWARQYDLTVSDVEGWIDEAPHRMGNRLHGFPRDIRESERRVTRGRSSMMAVSALT